MDPITLGIIVGASTLIVLLSGIPIAFGLSAIALFSNC